MQNLIYISQTYKVLFFNANAVYQRYNLKPTLHGTVEICSTIQNQLIHVQRSLIRRLVTLMYIGNASKVGAEKILL